MAVDGMPEAWALSLDIVATVPKAMLIARITELSPARMAQVCDALQVPTRC